MPKISDPVYPSQTGAQVANGDLMYIVDVGSPNISEKITVNELAQAPQFSSRYVSKSEEEYRWIGVSDLSAAPGTSPSMGSTGYANYGNGPGWQLDQSTNEGVVGSILLPDYWSTFKVEVWWVNNASSAGDVRLAFWGKWAGPGESPDGAMTAVDMSRNIAAVATAGQIVASQFPDTTNVTNVAGKAMFFVVFRQADQGADTLANDVGILGVLFTRMS